MHFSFTSSAGVSCIDVAAVVLPLATKSLMLEFCFTYPDSIRMLFPGGNTVTIQSTSATHDCGNKSKQKGKETKKKQQNNGKTEMDRWCFRSE